MAVVHINNNKHSVYIHVSTDKLDRCIDQTVSVDSFANPEPTRRAVELASGSLGTITPPTVLCFEIFG